jgi:hypothetical protein
MSDHVLGAIHTFLTRKSRLQGTPDSFTRERRQNGYAAIFRPFRVTRDIW